MSLSNFIMLHRAFIIRKIYRRIDIRPTKVILGRWKIENNKNKIDYKVEMANEDHCGPCGQSGPVKWNNGRKK